MHEYMDKNVDCAAGDVKGKSHQALLVSPWRRT